MDWSLLPAVNASLNSLATLLLILGYVLIRLGRRDAHRAVMIAALGCSALFLISYLTYHAQVGSVRFQGQGPIRSLYFTILLTHTVLAAIVPFMALRTAYLALRNRLAEHRRLARITLPIWLYVSVTGVVIYVMLYQMSF
jgi:uncharacterized membrane protein YozB (DUF420 family)